MELLPSNTANPNRIKLGINRDAAEKPPDACISPSTLLSNSQIKRVPREKVEHTLK
jgi:hypothetical protein